jgi:hypothetical protein
MSVKKYFNETNVKRILVVTKRSKRVTKNKYNPIKIVFLQKRWIIIYKY